MIIAVVRAQVHVQEDSHRNPLRYVRINVPKYLEIELTYFCKHVCEGIRGSRGGSIFKNSQQLISLHIE